MTPVALFDRGDEYHDWTWEGLGKIRSALIASASVTSKVLFLLRDMPRSRAAFLEFWSDGALHIAFDAEFNKTALAALRWKYSDAGISTADATLVRLGELVADALVWTLDKDFRIYWRKGRKVILLFDWPRSEFRCRGLPITFSASPDKPAPAPPRGAAMRR